ncbi:acyltransferase [Brevundimonas intermedia]|uniref:Acyltransferase n=1 Tax=Brevundimonas intermedia TaxID=74315 RepID=A0ABQ5T9J0_9CAUL|nr:acyltransferase [Brevundimonas intermedia]
MFVSLDAMRGIAALMVVLYHSPTLFGPIASRGYLAVDLFFVLSGFVIAHAYDARLATNLTPSAFIKLRVIRFWPLYAAGLALGLCREILLIASGNHYALTPGLLALCLAAALLFIPAPLASRDYQLFSLNSPSWSLLHELLVNVLYAVFFRFLTIPVLCGLGVASYIALALTAPASGISDTGFNLPGTLPAIARTLFSFTAGALLFRLKLKAPKISVALVLCVLMAALALPFGGRVYDLLFVALMSPALVWMGTACTISPKLHKLAAWLGLISFPIYAVHRPALAIAEAGAERLSLPPAAVGIGVLAALLLGCTYLAVPFDIWSRRKLTELSAVRPIVQKTAA